MDEAEEAWESDLTASAFGAVEADPPLNSELAQQRLIKAKRKSAPKRPPNSACQRCRQRKVRCDGGQPCAFCAARDGRCEYKEYTLPTARERQASESMAIVDSPADVDHSLMNAFRRKYYLDLYFVHINSNMPLVARRAWREGAVPSFSEQLQETIAGGISARALGHVDVANGLFSEAQTLFSYVRGDRTFDAATGIFLMGMYQIGEDHDMASQFFGAAVEVVRYCEPTAKAQMMLTMGSMLMDRAATMRRLSEGAPPLSSPTPFMTGGLERYDENKEFHNMPKMFNPEHRAHPFVGELTDHLRRFPLNSPVLDTLCRINFLQRFPLDQRSDEFLAPGKVEMMLRCLELGDKEYAIKVSSPALQLRTSEPVLFKNRIGNRARVALGMRLLMCTVGGLVRLGAHYAQLILGELQSLPSTVGFYRHHLLPVCGAVVAFVSIYRQQLAVVDIDYRIFMMEICDTLRPLQHFRFARELLDGAERVISENRNCGLERSPFDDDICTRWLSPDRDPLCYEALMSLSRKGESGTIAEGEKPIIELTGPFFGGPRPGTTDALAMDTAAIAATLPNVVVDIPTAPRGGLVYHMSGKGFRWAAAIDEAVVQHNAAAIMSGEDAPVRPARPRASIRVVEEEDSPKGSHATCPPVVAMDTSVPVVGAPPPGNSPFGLPKPAESSAPPLRVPDSPSFWSHLATVSSAYAATGQEPRWNAPLPGPTAGAPVPQAVAAISPTSFDLSPLLHTRVSSSSELDWTQTSSWSAEMDTSSETPLSSAELQRL